MMHDWKLNLLKLQFVKELLNVLLHNFRCFYFFNFDIKFIKNSIKTTMLFRIFLHKSSSYSSYHSKLVICLYLMRRKSYLPSFLLTSQKRCFNNFVKFTGKHMCWSLFWNKVAGWRPTNLLKRDLQIFLAQTFSFAFCENFKRTSSL